MKQILILLLALPLFNFNFDKKTDISNRDNSTTENTDIKLKLAMDYLDRSKVKVIGNENYAINTLKKYGGFNGGNSALYTIIVNQTGGNEFSIKRNEETIEISGDTYQGVVYFLDVFCGVRFYLPTDLFTSKRVDSVFIPKKLNIHHKPYALIFSTGFLGSDAYLWAKYHSNVYDQDLGLDQHTMTRRFYDSSILKLYPEVYSAGRPKSIQAQDWEPDFTAPTLVNAALYSSRKFFEANPNQNYISFGVMDSKRGYSGNYTVQQYSDMNAAFLNKLADSFKVYFPTKTIVYNLYSNVGNYPSFPLRDNILPITTYQLANAIGDKRFNDSTIDAYSKISKRVGNHDWAQGQGYLYPRIYTKLIDSFLLAYKKHGIKFDFAHLEMYPNWSLDGPKYYFMGKVYDNPEANCDSMLILFCRDMFDQAEREMYGYFSTLEKLGTTMENDYPFSNRKLYNYKSQFMLTDEEQSLASLARDYINKALSKTNGVDHQRINFFSNGFKITEGLFQIKNKGMEPAEISAYETFLKDSIAGNVLYLGAAKDTSFLDNMKKIIKQIE